MIRKKYLNWNQRRKGGRREVNSVTERTEMIPSGHKARVRTQAIIKDALQAKLLF